jgi:hypothetical protein
LPPSEEESASCLPTSHCPTNTANTDHARA